MRNDVDFFKGMHAMNRDGELVEVLIALLEYDPEKKDVPEGFEENKIFQRMKPWVDNAYTHWKNGSKGGRPKKVKVEKPTA